MLEGKGEWYESVRVGRRVTYKALRADLIDLMNNYPRAMSVIYVAPCTTGMPGDPDIERCERGLIGVMQYYDNNRSAKSWDFHLFLLSKWDRHARPLEGC